MMNLVILTEIVEKIQLSPVIIETIQRESI